MITGLDHIQIAIPAGAEDKCRAFYCDLLGLPEIDKPHALRGRGGFWVQGPGLEVHFGVDADFHSARKAHPAFRVATLDAVAGALKAQGHPVTWDTSLPGTRRFFSEDPVGNRLEFLDGT